MEFIKRLFKLKRHYIVFCSFKKEGVIYNSIDYVISKAEFINYKHLRKSLQKAMNDTVQVNSIIEVSKKELEQFRKN